MRSLWLVAFGGALGAVARAMLSTTIQSRWPSTLPWGTIAVNLSGCLILGLLSGVLESRPHLNPTWRAFGAVGVLGAFTTFSTFENETLALLQRGECRRRSPTSPSASSPDSPPCGSGTSADGSCESIGLGPARTSGPGSRSLRGPEARRHVTVTSPRLHMT